MFDYNISSPSRPGGMYGLYLKANGDVTFGGFYNTKHEAQFAGDCWIDEQTELEERPEPTNEAYNALMPRTPKRNGCSIAVFSNGLNGVECYSHVKHRLTRCDKILIDADDIERIGLNFYPVSADRDYLQSVDIVLK